MAALLLMISAFSTKPKFDEVNSGSTGGFVAPCTNFSSQAIPGLLGRKVFLPSSH